MIIEIKQKGRYRTMSYLICQEHFPDNRDDKITDKLLAIVRGLRIIVDSEDDDEDKPYFFVQRGYTDYQGNWHVEQESRVRADMAEYYSGLDTRMFQFVVEWIDTELSKPKNNSIFKDKVTNWDYICWLWDLNISNKQFNFPNEQPDYRRLELNNCRPAES
jgi:hypothetical protein